MDIKLKNVRIAFCQYIFKPGAMQEGQDKKFSSTFLIPKTDTNQIAEVEAAIKSAAEDKWGPKAKILDQLKKAGKTCLRDGEEKAQYDGYAECMFVNASSKVKPLVIDKDKTPLTEESGKPYGGCYVNCKLNIWAQDNSYGKRVNASLMGIQFAKDGDAFSGAAPAKADDFDDIADTGESLID